MKQEPELRPQHRKVMQAVSELHYANYQQLARHGFSPSSYTHVSEAAKELIDWGYLVYDFEKRGSEVGRSKRIVTYTKRGRAYCAREMPEALLPVTSPRHDTYFQEHKRGVADLIIAARQFAKANAGRVQVLLVQNDLVTGHNSALVTIEGKPKKVIPDLWLELMVDDLRRSFAFEYDRGTERDASGEKQWREKVRKYVRGFTAIRAHFAVGGFMVPIVIHMFRTEHADRRIQTLLTWTERELAEIFPDEAHRLSWAKLFAFAVADPATGNPTALFTAPWWVSPFERVPRALIEWKAA